MNEISRVQAAQDKLSALRHEAQVVRLTRREGSTVWPTLLQSITTLRGRQRLSWR